MKWLILCVLLAQVFLVASAATIDRDQEDDDTDRQNSGEDKSGHHGSNHDSGKGKGGPEANHKKDDVSPRGGSLIDLHDTNVQLLSHKTKTIVQENNFEIPYYDEHGYHSSADETPVGRDAENSTDTEYYSAGGYEAPPEGGYETPPEDGYGGQDASDYVYPEGPGQGEREQKVNFPRKDAVVSSIQKNPTVRKGPAPPPIQEIPIVKAGPAPNAPKTPMDKKDQSEYYDQIPPPTADDGVVEIQGQASQSDTASDYYPADGYEAPPASNYSDGYYDQEYPPETNVTYPTYEEDDYPSAENYTTDYGYGDTNETYYYPPPSDSDSDSEKAAPAPAAPAPAPAAPAPAPAPAPAAPARKLPPARVNGAPSAQDNGDNQPKGSYTTYETVVNYPTNYTVERTVSSSTYTYSSRTTKDGVEGGSPIELLTLNLFEDVKAALVATQKSVTDIMVKWVQDYTGKPALPLARFSRARLIGTNAANVLEAAWPTPEEIKDGLSKDSSEQDKLVEATLRALQAFQEEFTKVKADFNEPSAEPGANPVAFVRRVETVINDGKAALKTFIGKGEAREDEDLCC